MKTPTILNVDDREDDHFLLRRAVQKAGDAVRLDVLQDGQEAVEYLEKLDNSSGRENGSLPDLILLDLKMPRMDGFAVLDWIQKRPALRDVPVAIFTSSQNERDIERAYEKGAAWYLVKPVDFDSLLRLVEALTEWISSGDDRVMTKSSLFRPVPTHVDGEN